MIYTKNCIQFTKPLDNRDRFFLYSYASTVQAENFFKHIYNVIQMPQENLSVTTHKNWKSTHFLLNFVPKELI